MATVPRWAIWAKNVIVAGFGVGYGTFAFYQHLKFKRGLDTIRQTLKDAVNDYEGAYGSIHEQLKELPSWLEQLGEELERKKMEKEAKERFIKEELQSIKEELRSMREQGR